MSRKIIPLLALTLLFSGCSSLNPFSSGDEGVACPLTGVLDGAGTLTRFQRLGGQGVNDVVLEARISNIGTHCEVDGRTATIDMEVTVAAAKGPAATSQSHDVDYFIAIASPDGQILAREAFPITFNFPGARTTARAVEELTQRVPMAPGTRLTDYRLYVGLQLTQEELEYNRGAGRVR